MTAATPKQKQILDFVTDYKTRNGRFPTYDEISTEIGISKVTVFEHVEAMERKGLIQRTKNCARSIELPTHCPTCGRRNGK